MIKHIVFWRLKENAEGASKEENAATLKQILEALKESIPEIIHIEVGMNGIESPAAFEVALYSEFASFDDLKIYQAHPEHLKCKEFVEKVTSERAVVDYEI